MSDQKLFIPVLILFCLSFSPGPKSPGLEETAIQCFELFRTNKHQKLVDNYFCNDPEFWDYTWKSLGYADAVNTDKVKAGMKELRLKFKSQFLKSLADCYREGVEKHKITWSEVEDYSVTVHERTLTVQGNEYELIVPVVTFKHQGELLSWGFETLILTKAGKARICGDKVVLGAYMSLE